MKRDFSAKTLAWVLAFALFLCLPPMAAAAEVGVGGASQAAEAPGSVGIGVDETSQAVEAPGSVAVGVGGASQAAEAPDPVTGGPTLEPPINPDYIRWQNGEDFGGYVPEKFLDEREPNNGPAADLSAFGSFDAKYDPRYESADTNALTPAKNQNPYGVCWAFSTLGALESFVEKNTPGDTNPDFSERHLAYSLSNRAVGDIFGEDREPSDGSNCAYAANYLMRGEVAGPVLEDDDPFGNLKEERTIEDIKSIPRAGLVTGMTRIPNLTVGSTPGSETSRDYVTQIKALVSEYGATTISYEDAPGNYEKINEGEYAGDYCFFTASSSTNHGVMIVGWDDGFPMENFGPEIPEGDGAWLIKNSWNYSGPDEIHHYYAYFWMSYYTPVQDAWAVRGYDPDWNGAVYDYTPRFSQTSTGGYSSYLPDNSKWIANIFDTTEGAESLERVSFYNGNDPGTVYEVYIAACGTWEMTDEELLEEARNSHPVGSVIVDAKGYYSVDCGRFPLGDNMALAVMLKMKEPTGEGILWVPYNYVNAIVVGGADASGKSFQYEYNAWIDAGANATSSGGLYPIRAHVNGGTGFSTAERANTDDKAVSATKAALTWDAIKGSNTTQTAVTSNLALPANGTGGTAITWTSTNTSIIAADGAVARPSSKNGDAEVTVTATISKGSARETVVFEVTVTAMQAYAVTVTGGSGSDLYDEGETVSIIANDAAGGYRFKEWKTSPVVVFVEGTSAADPAAKFTMPGEAVAAEAVYELIPHDHIWGDWEKDESSHWKECACGEIDGLAAHSPGRWIIDMPAGGSRHRECTVCGFVTETEGIPAMQGPFGITASYLVIKKGDSRQLSITDSEGLDISQYVSWTSSDETVAAVDDDGFVDPQGFVAAAGAGSAIITAFNEELGITEECRVDVVDGPTVSETIEAVKLLKSSVTSNALSTNYAKVQLQLVLPQNRMGALGVPGGGETGESGVPGLSALAESGAQSIESVRLAKDTKGYFTTRILDDRYVEIIPTEALKTAKAKQLKTKLEVEVGGRVYTTSTLTINIKRANPKVKASAIKFNSFFPDEPKPVKVSASIGKVTDFELLEKYDYQKVNFNAESGTLSLKDKSSKPAKLALRVWVDEFTRSYDITFKVSVVSKKPSVKLNCKSVSMNRQAALRVTGQGVSGIEVVNNGDYSTTGPDENGNFTINYEGEGNVKAKTKLKLAVSITGTSQKVTLPLTIKKPPSTTSVKLSKTAVTLNKRLTNDYVIINATTAPYDAGLPAISGAHEDKFDIIITGKTIELRLKESAASGKTYTFKVGKTKFTIKVVDKAPAIALTAKGSINVINPGSTVTLTPKFTNINYHTGAEGARVALEGDSNFEIVQISQKGAVTLKMKEDAVLSKAVKPGVKQKISLTFSEDGENSVTAAKTITPKQGKATFVRSTKQIDLQKNDRYSEGRIDISVKSPVAAKIADVKVKGAHANLYSVRKIRDGSYAIGFKDSKIGAVGKGASIKLNVYFTGSDTPAAVSVKVAAK